MGAAGNRMRSIVQSGMRERVAEKAKMRAQWAHTEALYVKQRTWRKVATTAAKGTYVLALHISVLSMSLFYI